MSRSIAFGTLRQFLETLGFEGTADPDKYVAFWLDRPRPLIVLRYYLDSDIVGSRDLAIVKRTLAEFGVFPEEDFEARFSDQPLAG